MIAKVTTKFKTAFQVVGKFFDGAWAINTNKSLAERMIQSLPKLVRTLMWC
jgi:hypothetical protein